MCDMGNQHKIIIKNDDQSVEISKVHTKNGERFLLEADDSSTRLDPLALQSVSWQRIEDLQKLIGFPAKASGETISDKSIVDQSKPIQLSNEFAVVELQKITTTTDERLKIRSPRFGDTIHLGVDEIVALTRQEPELFYELLEEPFGPPRPDRVS